MGNWLILRFPYSLIGTVKKVICKEKARQLFSGSYKPINISNEQNQKFHNPQFYNFERLWPLEDKSSIPRQYYVSFKSGTL